MVVSVPAILLLFLPEILLGLESRGAVVDGLQGGLASLPASLLPDASLSDRESIYGSRTIFGTESQSTRLAT